TEAIAEQAREPLILAEDDTDEQCAAVAAHALERARNVRAKPVGDRTETATPPDHPPPVGVEDDVHSAPAQHLALVVPVLIAPRQLDRGDERQPSTLRRGAA